MSFQIIRNDITKVKSDAIVNTANPMPKFAGGTDSAVYMSAGPEELLAARKKIGEIAPGDAVETPAFKLEAKYIIHTVGPVWEGGDKGEFDILRSCYENSLNLALKLKCESIAFPLIATGVYGFPKDKALQIALSVIQPFVMEHDMKVTLVVFDKKAFELSGKIIDNIREYVDSHYVDEANEFEYSNQFTFYGNRPPRDYEEETEERERSIIERRRRNERAHTGFDEPDSKVSISNMIASSGKTFQEKLFEIIDARGLKAPQVYYPYVSKQVFSKIQCDKDYHPNKYTAIALCLQLHLNLQETQDLIGRAGWTLSSSNKMDLIVQACIMNKEYKIVNIDAILFDYDLPELRSIK